METEPKEQQAPKSETTNLDTARQLKSLADRLILNKHDQPAKTTYNLMQILSLHPDWKDVFFYNERDMMIYIGARPPYHRESTFTEYALTDSDYINTKIWFEKIYGLNFPTTTICEGINTISKDQFQRDPLKDYLQSIAWDGAPRLDTWLIDHASVPDSDYSRAISSKYLISAIARTYQPGCKVDTMLILQGRQGAKKSMMLQVLVGEQYFTDHIENIQDKDSRIQLQGPMIIEFSELDAFSKKEASAVKAFVTTQVDRFRAPYAKAISKVPRRCVFAGTTNDTEFLRDQTGGRRFWPVRTGDIDIDGIKANREQILAEAVYRYKHGEEWWLGGKAEAEAMEHQEAVREKDTWEDMVTNYMSRAMLDVKIKWHPCFGTSRIRKWIAVAEMLDLLGIEAKDASRHTRKINAVAVAIGLKKSGTRPIINGEKHSVYKVPASFYDDPDLFVDGDKHDY